MVVRQTLVRSHEVIVLGQDLRMRFHFGTSKAPTAWTVSRVGKTGSHSCGRGLKLSFRSRVEASELLLDRWSACRTVKVSSEETRFSDMAGGHAAESQSEQKNRRTQQETTR